MDNINHTQNLQQVAQYRPNTYVIEIWDWYDTPTLGLLVVNDTMYLFNWYDVTKKEEQQLFIYVTITTQMIQKLRNSNCGVEEVYQQLDAQVFIEIENMYNPEQILIKETTYKILDEGKLIPFPNIHFPE